MPHTAVDLLARTLGVTQVAPLGRTIGGIPQHASPLGTDPATGAAAGIFELTPAAHGHLLYRYGLCSYVPPYPREAPTRFVPVVHPFSYRSSIVGAQRSIAHFFTTAWGGRAEIAVTGAAYPGLAPVLDHDDDTWCDAQETAAIPATDPYDPASRPSGGTPMCARDVGFARTP